MTNQNSLQLFATTPKGLELLLVNELRALGAEDPAEKLAGVTFTGDLALAYKACLWSRLANRILLRLTKISAATPEELYTGVQTIPWEEHIQPGGTLYVNFVTSHSNITHTLYGAQKVKDAIVDQLREKFDKRPTIVHEKPDVCVHVHLQHNIANISIDLSGESLHRRGYRLEQGVAPLKENLAAAILLRASWDTLAKEKAMLFDPMCGSGTLLIEGALIAGNIAPGLFRQYFGFLGWKKHQALIWQQLLKEAEQQRDVGVNQLPAIVGYDHNPQAIKVAFANIERAGLHGKIHVEKRELSPCVPKSEKGLLVTNPPYGERLGEISALKKLYSQLGLMLKQHFMGWRAGVFSGNQELGKSMGLRSYKYYALFNGTIPCQLLLFDVKPEYFVDRSPEANNIYRIKQAKKNLTEADCQAAEMFANRLRKNLKKLKKWADKEKVSCYRLYDSDLPEYAVSIDRYEENICIQEYKAPKSIDENKAKRRLQQIFSIVAEVLDILPARIFFREEKNEIDDVDSLYPAKADGAHFLINLIDKNISTGLPLEQRILRQHIQREVQGKSFLNLFSGAGPMNVMAGLGQASSITAICANTFYENWAKQNMILNSLNGQFIQEDSIQWMKSTRLKFDIIFAELPESTFHLRQNYPNLLSDIVYLLKPEGVLYLITKDSRFKLDLTHSLPIKLFEISQEILPYDFERHPNIQQCWRCVKT